MMGEHDSVDSDIGTISDSDTETKRPKHYRVCLHNDDYTTMEFVVFILQHIFKRPLEKAKQIMHEVHKTGMGVCGIYNYEVAETKMLKVAKLAKDHGHPLRCTMDPEE